jgi:transcriptional regulator with XRE-family HTH domain
MDGKEFRALRERLGLSRRRLADLLGISPDTIVRRERDGGVKPIEALALTALAQIARSDPHHWRRKILDTRRQEAIFLDAMDIKDEELEPVP